MANDSTPARETRWRQRLEEKLKLLPGKPGIYLMKNGRSKIIYIGKAKSLPSRVRSYFRGKAPDQRLQMLRDQIRDFDYLVTASEAEALVLESNLIKSHRPYFNIDLKDDKKYPFVKINLKHEFPRMIITRKVVADGASYFGPFVRVGNLRQLIRSVRRLFPLRSCTDRTLGSRDRECLDYFIDICPAPCTGRADPEVYRKTAKQLVHFLEGRSADFVTSWRQQMTELADELRFEESARIRDDINAVERLQQRQRMTDLNRPDLDAIGLSCRGDLAVATVLSQLEGKVEGSWRIQIGGAANATESEILRTIISEHYQGRDRIPSEIACNILPADPELLENWLGDKIGRKVKITRPARGRRTSLVRAAVENAALNLEETEALELGRRKRLDSALFLLQEGLDLPQPPRRIEGYDISNIQGTKAVGSQVVFTDCQPYKSAYRRYRIKTVTGSDDFAMIAEMLDRRLKRLAANSDEARPDLILIDGGKGQVNRAAQILINHGFDAIPLIGLAKREEEVFFAGCSKPHLFPKSSPGLHLLQRVRDEAHRFAVTYHRQLRSEPLRKTPLEQVNGLGQAKRRALIRHFGNVSRVVAASREQLLEAPGIGPALTEKILEALGRGGKNE